MGKASKWFRGLLGLKKTEYTTSPAKPPKEKRRWSFVKSSHTEKDNTTTATCTPQRDNNNNNNNKHAMAVAAATAAVAEAAVAAAEAAAVVVRLTSSSGRCANAGPTRIRQHWAAVKIQAAFRGCLARRALRALKGLVKLQAYVRGHIERKRTAEWLKRVQSLLHAQAQVSAGLTTLHASPSSSKLSSHLHGPETPEKFESPIRSKSMKHEQSPILKRNGSKSCVLINGYQEICGGSRSESQVNEQSWNSGRSLIRTFSSNDERNDRVLEIDSGKPPNFTLKRRNLSYSTGSDNHYSKSLNSTKESTASLQSGQSPSCCEVQSHSYISQKVNEVEESPFCTADNSPQYLSATSKDDGFKRSPFTPTKSDGSRCYYIRGYADYPSYMACTESSKAKVRSLSAPKQRPQQSEKSGSSNRYSLNAFDMSRLATQRAMHASFTNKAYPGSGRLDKLGMPVGYRF